MKTTSEGDPELTNNHGDAQATVILAGEKMRDSLRRLVV